jgi:hypothetical protein
MAKNKGYSAEDYVLAYAKAGSVRKVAAALGVSHTAVEQALKRADMQPSKTALYGTAGSKTKTVKKAAPKTGVKRYVVTAAQSETKAWAGFGNLLALVKYYDAELLIAPYAYNVQAFGHQSSAKPGAKKSDDTLFSAMDPAFAPYLTSSRVQLAPGLVFCGEVQILPTAADPLSGMENYTGRASGIFPHAKIEMRSVASMKHEPTKFNYTTGCVTRHNYIQKKAGQKGEFHHAYGALLVEVTADGWWVRQLNADKNNTIYDLDVYAATLYDEDGPTVYESEGAEALICGDLHIAEMDDGAARATWGSGGLIDVLKPKQQILHDVFDMRSRPWQDELDFHRQFEKHVNGQERVEDEVKECAEVLRYTILPGVPKTVIVRSNHDRKLEKWLTTGDYKRDLVNASFFLRAQLAKVEAILAGRENFKVLEWALNATGLMPEDADVLFLNEDTSYILCKDGSGGIEAGLHGDLGANGAKGTPKGFQKMARKLVFADKHSCGIWGGAYGVGHKTAPTVKYTKGPSSWSLTDCVVYPNGKRALLTYWAGSYFAPRGDL